MISSSLAERIGSLSFILSDVIVKNEMELYVHLPSMKKIIESLTEIQISDLSDAN